MQLLALLGESRVDHLEKKLAGGGVEQRRGMQVDTHDRRIDFGRRIERRCRNIGDDLWAP